ncbi:retron St85 family RNA-directed DNA polymerase [Acinetobacter gyllenbergii]|uniref:retron St85 family RNA-directed DNA polymerase n=1 Tax=Acinetobacter gyllenbergii TaxID=134534 RepID=UPI0003BFD076|nr:retron St85 family RNA-directed DNA polymerase [Acinetobacter gyllenbergii]ESK35571.1 hypothetical protein F987_04152 [Acinetobacter gyllenbergii NIPH 230]
MSLIDELAFEFNKSKEEIRTYLLQAPSKYKVYLIPKRKVGKRVIAQPTKDLKLIQRFILAKKLKHLPIHDAAFAYVKNKSIKNNAAVHLSNSYLLNLDLEDFFNSITPKLFWRVWKRTIDQVPEVEERRIYNQFLFWQPKKNSKKLILSIGAPSSPYISNFILYELDRYLTVFCKNNFISYSRYADDLTFSSNVRNSLFKVPKVVEDKLFDLYEGEINLNHSKTVFSSKAKNRHVTGLVLTNDGKISIGRAKKRFIKHLVYRFKIGELEQSSFQYVSGYLNFIQDVEPVFLESLKFKYTEEVVNKIMLGVWE